MYYVKQNHRLIVPDMVGSVKYSSSSGSGGSGAGIWRMRARASAKMARPIGQSSRVWPPPLNKSGHLSPWMNFLYRPPPFGGWTEHPVHATQTVRDTKVWSCTLTTPWCQQIGAFPVAVCTPPVSYMMHYKKCDMPPCHYIAVG